MTAADQRWRDLPSPNHGVRREGTPVDMLVLHYTGMTNAKVALDRLCNPDFGVSAHYVIDEEGLVWRLVPETLRAWHAGASYWAGESDINSRSIGVELVNPGHEHGYRVFPDAQMAALIELSRGILTRHPIPPHRILGHSDVAPDRKLDPGELFGWRHLADAGIGLWPDPAPRVQIVDERFDALMRTFGYADGSMSAITAFQRHFHPENITGIADDETRSRLVALVKQAGLA